MEDGMSRSKCHTMMQELKLALKQQQRKAADVLKGESDRPDKQAWMRNHEVCIS